MSRHILYGLAGAGVSLLVLGVPTDLLPNPLFTRMVPPRPLDYLALVVVVALSGLLAATYAYPAACPTAERRTLAGSMLTLFGIACPTCNKLALLLLGTSGALAYLQPLQPLLSVFGIGLLVSALLLRVRALRSARPSMP
ncbi:hypothetical protein NET02_12520 [Thermomicrobiaceae bacterium CFH 74404]|uniref:Uncharacterized protein n=1 Tax=Thermalbibacter longus TaxID=2951981 RepID=A0AA41WBH3_9BACT|nr:hypothetical protein [Thermalbibacter longus]MCM8749974.1 hypothetical protein [Thermalbibacter longus]